MQALTSGSFFQLLTELVKVETGLLMNDAVALRDSKPQVASGNAGEPSANRQSTPGALYAAFHDQPQPGAPGPSKAPLHGTT